jgi:hypothetical protein
VNLSKREADMAITVSRHRQGGNGPKVSDYRSHLAAPKAAQINSLAEAAHENAQHRQLSLSR